MIFTATYRDKSGSKATLELDEPNKAAVWAELKKRGISPIAVNEGKAKSDAGRPAAKRPSPLRGVVAGLVVVALAAGVWWWMSARDETPASAQEKPKRVQSPRPEPPPRKPAAKSAAQQPQPKPKKEPLPKGKRRDIRGNIINVPKNPWGQPIPPELEYKPIWEYTTEDYAKVDPGYLARHKAHKERQAAIPWKTDADRQLAILLFSKDGNTGLLPPFNRRFKEQFLKSIETPITVSKDDPPELKEQKRQMIEAKVYLKERMDAGEDIVDILNDEYKNAQKTRALRQNLQEELRKLEKTATSVQEVQDYIDAANKMLDEQGAAHVGLPLILTRRRLEREAAAQGTN